MIVFFLIIYFLTSYISAKLKELFKNRLSDFDLFREILSAFIAFGVVLFISCLLNLNVNIFGHIIKNDAIKNIDFNLLLIYSIFVLIFSLLVDIFIIHSKKILDWLYETLSNLFKNK